MVYRDQRQYRHPNWWPVGRMRRHDFPEIVSGAQEVLSRRLVTEETLTAVR